MILPHSVCFHAALVLVSGPCAWHTVQHATYVLTRAQECGAANQLTLMQTGLIDALQLVYLHQRGKVCVWYARVVKLAALQSTGQVSSSAAWRLFLQAIGWWRRCFVGVCVPAWSMPRCPHACMHACLGTILMRGRAWSSNKPFCAKCVWTALSVCGLQTGASLIEAGAVCRQVAVAFPALHVRSDQVLPTPGVCGACVGDKQAVLLLQEGRCLAFLQLWLLQLDACGMTSGLMLVLLAFDWRRYGGEGSCQLLGTRHSQRWWLWDCGAHATCCMFAGPANHPPPVLRDSCAGSLLLC